ncbi:MAG: DUF3276 family protein [Bacteroidales bacterium]|nr:DUF3276 family protein [Bacteroidales bacterium]
MEEFEKKEQENDQERDSNQHDSQRHEIFSETVRAGKRTYFFDVKSTRAGEYYLTITESKRRFNNDQGKFFYEKHKLFLYKEDFEKFSEGLNSAIEFIQSGQPHDPKSESAAAEKDPHTDVEFDDLGSETSDISVERDDDTKNTD